MTKSELSISTTRLPAWLKSQPSNKREDRSTQSREGQRNRKVRAVVLVLLGLTAIAFAHGRRLMAQTTVESAKREVWRTTMSHTRLPNKGCFSASYPSGEWRPVACGTAPPRSYRQHPGQQQHAAQTDGKAQAVGNTDDYELQSAGTIIEAIGTFYSVNGVTSASDADFSLQLNSNFFTTSTCNGASDPSQCQGWEQFVFSNSGSLFIQNWLINYGTCPSGWNTFGSDCYINSQGASVPVQSITNLASLGLTGLASGGTDTVYFSMSNGDITAMEQDSVLNLEQGWNAAEFNVFGDGGGSQVNINSGSTLVPEIRIDDGTSNVPSCPLYGTTGETNSLSLSNPCCPYLASNGVPSVQFIETNLPNPASVCGGGEQVTGISMTVNDPSQTTPLSLGHSMTYAVNVTPLNGYGGSVGFSMSNVPAGLSYSFSPQTINMSGSSTLTLTAAYSPSTYVGSSTAYVDGTAVGLDDSAELTVNTQPLQYKGDCGVQSPAFKTLSARAAPLAFDPIKSGPQNAFNLSTGLSPASAHPPAAR